MKSRIGEALTMGKRTKTTTVSVTTGRSVDELLQDIFGMTEEDFADRDEAIEFFRSIETSELPKDTGLAEELRRIRDNTFRMVHQMDIEEEEFDRVVAAFCERCRADERIGKSPEFSNPHEDVMERCSHTLTGMSGIIEDRLPIQLRRERTALVTVDWSKKGGWAVWERESEGAGVSVLSAAQHAAKYEGEFEECLPFLAERIVEELRNKQLNLPNFSRESDEGNKTVFRWLPPEVTPAKGLPPDFEVEEVSLALEDEVELWEQAPVLAWLLELHQSRLLLTKAMVREPVPPRGRNVLQTSPPVTVTQDMHLNVNDLVATLEANYPIPRKRIVYVLSQTAMSGMELSMMRNDVQGIVRGRSAMDALLECT